MVDEYPYIVKIGTVKKFLEHIQDAGIPEKIHVKYIESVGFKSKNDRPIVKILKFIGFLDSSGVPTKHYRHYHGTAASGAVLADRLRQSYRDLFKMYPDAHRKDDKTLHDFFGASSKLGSAGRSLVVKTFRSLCEMADFDAKGPRFGTGPTPAEDVDVPVDAAPPRGAPEEFAVNINIQLELPATDKAEIYDKLFASLRKHLIDRKKGE